MPISLRGAFLVAVVMLSACGLREARLTGGPLKELPNLRPAPRLITSPTAVLFWLPQGDTLSTEERDAARAGLALAAATLGDLLDAYGIPVMGVSAGQVYVQAPGAPRRTVMLAGLDYPWGVVLVDPGYPEQILTGPIEAGELEDLAWDYFLLEEGVRGPERTAAAQAPLLRCQNQYAGSPRATMPSPTTVWRSGWLTMVLRTIATADRMKRSGVQG